VLAEDELLARADLLDDGHDLGANLCVLGLEVE
jgi:hypothetical protein